MLSEFEESDVCVVSEVELSRPDTYETGLSKGAEALLRSQTPFPNPSFLWQSRLNERQIYADSRMV